MSDAAQADLLLAELFAIQSAGETCAVRMAADGRELWLNFESGTLVHTEAPATNAPLGDLLVREGKLTPAQLGALIEDLAEAARRGEPARLGDAALTRGFLTQRELGLALLADLRATLIEALTWEDPTFAVVPVARDARVRARFPTSIEPLVLSAFRRLSRLRLAALVQPLLRGAPPILLEPADAMRALFRTRVEENEALGAVIREGGSKMLAEMMKGSRGPHDGLPFVAALAAAGSLTWPGGPPSQRSNPPPPRLVVPLAARPERLSRTAKKSALSPLAPKGHSPLRWLLAEEGERATTEPAASASARIVAERSFDLGKAHLERGDDAAAKAEFWRAHQLDPGMAEYELYLGWLTLRGDEQRAAELESIAIRAKRQAPELGFASYVLSHLALLRGDVDRAEAEQQRAARLGVREAAPLPSSIAFFPAKLLTLEPVLLRDGSLRPADKKQRLPRPPRRRSAAPLPPPKERDEPAALAPAHGDVPADALTDTPDPAGAEPIEAPAVTQASPRLVGVLTTLVAEGAHAEPPREASKAEAAHAVSEVASEATSERALPPATEPRDDASSALPPEAGPLRSRWPFALAGVAVAVGALLLARAWNTDPTAPPPSDATALPSTASAAALPATASSDAASSEVPGEAGAQSDDASFIDAKLDATVDAEVDATVDASLAGSPATPSHTIPKGMGEILVEGAPAGRRIFVGRHAVGETPAVVLAPCGEREVRIGSRGTPRTVDIPCGRRVTLRP